MNDYEEPVPKSDNPVDIAVFVDRRVAASNRKLTAHIDRRFEELENYLLRAFPKNSPEINRQVIESIIQKNKDRSEFWRQMRITLAKRGVVIAVAIVGFGALLVLKDFIMKGM